jgi:hypothetical protein
MSIRGRDNTEVETFVTHLRHLEAGTHTAKPLKSVSPASPTPAARTKSSRLAQDQRWLGRQPSNRSNTASGNIKASTTGTCGGINADRLFDNDNALIDHCCNAWNKLEAQGVEKSWSIRLPSDRGKSLRAGHQGQQP